MFFKDQGQVVIVQDLLKLLVVLKPVREVKITTHQWGTKWLYRIHKNIAQTGSTPCQFHS